MTSGSVSPCPTSVARITANVRKTIRSRPGNGVAAVRLERQRQRGRERHGAAHSGPGDEDGAAPVGHPPDDPLRRVQHREDPREAQDDHREAHERGVAEEPRRGDALQRVEDDRELEADEHEEERVEEVLDDLPDGERLKPDLRRRELRRVPAEVDAGRHRREDGRDAEQLGREEREVPGEERDRDLGGRVVQAQSELPHQPADHEPHEHASACADDEEPARIEERERAGHDRDDGEPVQDQPAAVVDEALPLDDRHELARDAEPAGDRRRRERVGR